ncbi:hypothetical protein HOLleu_00760 [Holothuria leucospilota]|uniref:Uncharacterized protein n=1 Tax=Holothuria leucospilota TaxID=206669 RepID=A0A9Q1CPJ2_HOLLE|nr:hypothetical protein HOLleu_00760 [Holothuria leucospilota]
MQGAFDGMRKEGILMANQEQMKEATLVYERERRTGKEDPLVLCGLCKGFYPKICFSRYKVKCKGDGCSHACSVPLSLLSQESDITQGMSSYEQEILCSFGRDNAGQLCLIDPVIRTVGKRMWDKEKNTEVRKSVMTSMRRLASLYLAFKEQHKIHGSEELTRGNARDMFDRKHFVSH